VHLTTAGRKLLREIPPPGPDVEQAMLRGIYPRAAATFELVGGHMIENLEEALRKEEDAE
jgi:hypothetical protein